MSTYTFHTRISYHDIDAHMALTLRGAMNCMQEAAILHADQVGNSISDLAQNHLVWMLVQWHVKLLGEASWNDSVDVVTWPRSMERLTSVRNFELLNSRGERIAVGASNWILVNTDTGRVTRITPEIAALYDLTPRDVFDDPLPKAPQGLGDETFAGRVLRRDLDTNHHVNNLVYLDYSREALPEEAAAMDFREISVYYHKQLFLGDPIRCYYHSDGTRHVVNICGDSAATLHATVVFS